MKPGSRRLLRTSGAAIVVLLFMLCGVSLRWTVHWQSRSGQHRIILANGNVYRLNLTWLGDGMAPPRASWAIPPPGGWAQTAGWRVRDSHGGLDFWGRHRPLNMKSGVVSTSYPLAPIMLLVGVLVVVSWWRERRNKPRHGHCRKCGYNLTGNVSGVCPECGEKI